MSDQSDKTDQTNRFDEDLLVSGDRPLSIPAELPVLPLRDTVLFPNSFMPLAVAREASVRLIDEATTSGRMIGVFTQREASVEEPLLEDLYPIGTATHIHKMFKLPDGSLRLIVQGLARVRLDRIVQTRPYLRGAVVAADESLRDEDHLEIDALQRNIKSNFQQVVSLSPAAVGRPAGAGREHHRPRQAGRLHRLEPDDHRHAGEAGGARHARHPRPDGLARTGS